MEKLISIIIPVYNHSGTIEGCLYSIYKQSYRPIEVIVVDDGSTDNLKEKMLKLGKKEWVKQLDLRFISQKNSGAPAARNAGFLESKGEYVIFWDADTKGDEMMLEKMAVLLDQPEVGFVYSKFKFGFKTMNCQSYDPEDLKRYNYIDVTSLVRRNVLPAKPFDEKIKRFQDWDLWLTLSENNIKGYFIPELLYKKQVVGRKGISSWLPKFMYRLPWQTRKVKNYNEAKNIILRKHHLLKQEAVQEI